MTRWEMGCNEGSDGETRSAHARTIIRPSVDPKVTTEPSHVAFMPPNAHWLMLGSTACRVSSTSRSRSLPASLKAKSAWPVAGPANAPGDSVLSLYFDRPTATASSCPVSVITIVSPDAVARIDDIGLPGIMNSPGPLDSMPSTSRKMPTPADGSWASRKIERLSPVSLTEP